MAVKFSNNGKTTLSSGITTSATSLTVVDGSVLPAITGSEYFFLTLEDTSGNVEIVKVTARSGNSLTVTRAQESTTARAFSAGDKAENRLTAGGLNEVAEQADTDTTYTVGDGGLTQNNFTDALKSKLDGVEANATADQTKSDIDALNIDADLLDGQHGSHYLDYNNFTNTPTIPTNNNQLTNGAGYITSADGGNAATLDSIDSSQFLRSDASDTMTGDLDVTGAITADGMTIDGGDVTVNGEYADNVFMVDYSTGRVGVNLGSGNTPSNALHVNGTVQFSGSGSNSGYQTTVTTYASSTTFYRANGDLSFHAGSSSYPKLTLTNSGTLTYDSQSVGTQSIVTTAPTSATGFPNGHVWYVVS